MTNHRFFPFHNLKMKQKSLKKSSFFGPPKVFWSKIKETVYQLGKKNIASWNCVNFMILLLNEMKFRASLDLWQSINYLIAIGGVSRKSLHVQTKTQKAKQN